MVAVMAKSPVSDSISTSIQKSIYGICRKMAPDFVGALFSNAQAIIIMILIKPCKKITQTLTHNIFSNSMALVVTIW